MSESNSLYRLTPPGSPQRPAFRLPSSQLDEQSLTEARRSSVATNSYQSKHRKHALPAQTLNGASRTETYRAPIAQMTSTPSGRRVAGASFPTTNSEERTPSRRANPSPPVLRSKRKEESDYQAEADLQNAAQEDADPDFAGPCSSAETDESPRKKRKVEPEAVASSSRLRGSSQRHAPYDNCKQGTQKKRDRYIACIVEKWHVRHHHWMPQSLLPRVPLKQKSGMGAALKPEDWNTRLLEQLSYLSRYTVGNVEEASAALQEAVSHVDRTSSGPELTPQDVREAVELLNIAEYPRVIDAELDSGIDSGQPADAIGPVEVETNAQPDNQIRVLDMESSKHLPIPSNPPPVQSNAVVDQLLPEEPVPITTGVECKNSHNESEEYTERCRVLQLRREMAEHLAEAKRAELELLEYKIQNKGGSQ